MHICELVHSMSHVVVVRVVQEKPSITMSMGQAATHTSMLTTVGSVAAMPSKTIGTPTSSRYVAIQTHLLLLPRDRSIQEVRDNHAITSSKVKPACLPKANAE